MWISWQNPAFSFVGSRDNLSTMKVLALPPGRFFMVALHSCCDYFCLYERSNARTFTHFYGVVHIFCPFIHLIPIFYAVHLIKSFVNYACPLPIACNWLCGKCG